MTIGIQKNESARRARRTSLQKRARNRRQAKRGENLLQRARTGANSGLRQPTRRGILRLYKDDE